MISDGLGQPVATRDGLLGYGAQQVPPGSSGALRYGRFELRPLRWQASMQQNITNGADRNGHRIAARADVHHRRSGGVALADPAIRRHRIGVRRLAGDPVLNGGSVLRVGDDALQGGFCVWRHARCPGAALSLFLAENAHQQVDFRADVHESKQQADPDHQNNRPETNVGFDRRLVFGLFHSIAFHIALQRRILIIVRRRSAPVQSP